jgi:mRNA interferase MazF
MPTSEPFQPFERGEVVKVPFPYTDRATRQRRPALVISSGDLQRRHDVAWVLMITSAANRGWEGDFDIDDLSLAGLPVPSVIRTAKVATVDARDLEPLGRVNLKVLGLVDGRLQSTLFADSAHPSR